jgi:DNA helicase-2/ATP-dependent DNA helicase PcrA
MVARPEVPTPEIVLGPPGTGKTTTLLDIVDAELAKGVPPDRIAYVSFTRRAATEAQERAMAKFGLSAKQLPYFRTIHSLCFQTLGMRSSEVMEGPKLVEFGDWIGMPVTGMYSAEEGRAFGFERGDRCLHLDNLARVKNVPLRQQYDEAPDDLPWLAVEHVSRGLKQYKEAKGLRDYTDMLEEVAKVGFPFRLTTVIVDEGQDLSILQWMVIWRLAENCERMYVAGDDDQAIYRWAGAAVEYFVSMKGNARVLRQSWRVPSAVHTAALEVLRGVVNRRPKEWVPRGEPGELVRASSLDEIDFHAGEDTLVLARNACFLRDDAMKLLRSEGVIYEFRGANSVKSSVVGGILTWERLRRGERVPVEDAVKMYDLLESEKDVARGYKKLPGLGEEHDVSMEDLVRRGGLKAEPKIWHEALRKISADDRAYMLKALRRGDRLTAKPSVRLSTIHGSKGGQADHVVLVRDMAWRTYREAEFEPEDEARVWYVGATRAKQRLTIVAPQTRRGYDI